MRHWDWSGMVEANRGRLLRLLAGLVALLGPGPVVSRRAWRRILVSLVPVESAARRLVFVMARDLVAAVPSARRRESGARTRGGAPRRPVFALTDRPRIPDPPPRRCPERHAPRVSFPDEWVPRAAVPGPCEDDPLDAAALRRRMEALGAALADLPAQAARLARWRARNARAREAGTWARVHPLRTGRPPGHRERHRRPAHALLADCHDLAVRCLRMTEREARGG